MGTSAHYAASGALLGSLLTISPYLLTLIGVKNACRLVLVSSQVDRRFQLD